MLIPASKQFGKGDRVYVRAQQAWIILTGFLEFGRPNKSVSVTLSYGDLAEYMGLDRRAGITLNRSLGIIGVYCTKNDMPPINVVVVNQDTKLPGSEVVLRSGKNIQQEQRAVLKHNWLQVRVPTTGTLRKIWESMND